MYQILNFEKNCFLFSFALIDFPHVMATLSITIYNVQSSHWNIRMTNFMQFCCSVKTCYCARRIMRGMRTRIQAKSINSVQLLQCQLHTTTRVSTTTLTLSVRGVASTSGYQRWLPLLNCLIERWLVWFCIVGKQASVYGCQNRLLSAFSSMFN